MKKNGFISKQLQKILAPAIDDCLHICYDLIEQFTKKEFISYDDYTNLCKKVEKYEDFEKLVLDELKKKYGGD